MHVYYTEIENCILLKIDFLKEKVTRTKTEEF